MELLVNTQFPAPIRGAPTARVLRRTGGSPPPTAQAVLIAYQINETFLLASQTIRKAGPDAKQ
jgi:hypothetical protein